MWQSAQTLSTDNQARALVHVWTRQGGHWQKTHQLEKSATSDLQYQTRQSEAIIHREYKISIEDRLQLHVRASTATTQEMHSLRSADSILATGLTLLYLAIMWFIYVLVRREVRPLTVIADKASLVQADAIDSASTFVQSVTGKGQSHEIYILSHALNDMLVRIEETMQRERQFSAAAAHELRTPVAQLITSLEIALRKERTAENYRTILQDALTDGKRLAALMAAMLTLTSSAVSADTEYSSVLFAEVLEDWRAIGVDIEVPDPIDQDIRLFGERTLYTIVLRNLIDNAQRYAGHNPQLHIEKKAQHVSVCIADAGPGIDKKDRERIFQALVRLDSARTIGDESAGFGLGLAIVTNILRKAGATISCRENVGGGALFEILIPIVVTSKLHQQDKNCR